MLFQIKLAMVHITIIINTTIIMGPNNCDSFFRETCNKTIKSTLIKPLNKEN